MQKARRHRSRGSDRLRAHGFRVSFTPLSAVLFTFPSRYSCAIGLPGVLSLGGWCRRIRTGLLRPRPTQGSGLVRVHSGYGAVTPCGAPFQASSPMRSSSVTPALQPRARLDARGLGWPPFARRYSGGHSCFPFLRLLGCFGSSGSPPHKGMPRLRAAGCPIRTPADQRPFAPPRRLSRPAASFLASGSQGILRAPSLASRSRLSHAPHSLRGGVRSCVVSSLCLLSLSHPVKEPRGSCLAAYPALVENVGLEPTTPGLQSRCSSLLSQSPADPCSPGQTRTADPHIISVVL